MRTRKRRGDDDAADAGKGKPKPGSAGDADPVSAELAKLEGQAYERALAAMSEEKRDRHNCLG